MEGYDSNRLSLSLQGLVGGVALFGLLALAQPAAAAGCEGITIDNDPADWEDVESIVSDEQEETGLVYYYDGSAWKTESSGSDLYSTDLQLMQDLEVLKVCNSATQLQLYIDAYHPLLAYLDIESGDYFEFGDGNGPDGSLVLPADLDFWLVFKLQETDSSSTFYYAIYFYAQEGDLGLETGPTQTAIYKESEDVKFNEATFNPNEDELLVEIEDDSSKDDSKKDGGKNVDVSGGFETDVPLVNSDGTGLFNVSNILYSDTLKMTVATYSGTDFSAGNSVNRQAEISPFDETDKTTYKIKKASVVGLSIPDKKRTATEVRVKWDTLSDATSYQVRVTTLKGKKLLTDETTNTYFDVTGLEAGHTYLVQVRALVGELYTSWSKKVEFKTRKSD
ncbi:MAG: fibronectin type III domain-containing protein [Patescibacteria group bacterium]